MRIKSIFKWTLRLVLIALLLSAITIFIAYWRSTNDCERYGATPANPMKAVIHCEYGKPEVLQVKDLEKPTPDDDQLLVRVRAASLNPLDGHFVRGMLLARAMGGGMAGQHDLPRPFSEQATLGFGHVQVCHHIGGIPGQQDFLAGNEEGIKPWPLVRNDRHAAGGGFE